MQFNWHQGALAEGLRCYRAQQFFAAHEHWEAVWLTAPEPERTFLQGIIQVAAALHHKQRGNQQGMSSLLRAALGRLETYPESFGGIRVSLLRSGICAWLASAEQQVVANLAFPQIETDD